MTTPPPDANSATIEEIVASLSFSELEKLKQRAAIKQEELKTSGMQELVDQFEDACMSEFGMSARQVLRAAAKLKGKGRRRRAGEGSNGEVH